MVYVSLRVLKEITKPELREYLCDQIAWFVNKLHELKDMKIA